MSRKVRIGEIVKVENYDKKKFSNENPYYFAVIVKYKVEGKTKKKVLFFTKIDLDRAADRADKNIEMLDVEQSLYSKIVD